MKGPSSSTPAEKSGDRAVGNGGPIPPRHTKIEQEISMSENETVYLTYRLDMRWIGGRKTEERYHNTQEEAIAWLEKNGGGVYENLLHRFTMPVSAEN